MLDEEGQRWASWGKLIFRLRDTEGTETTYTKWY